VLIRFFVRVADKGSNRPPLADGLVYSTSIERLQSIHRVFVIQRLFLTMKSTTGSGSFWGEREVALPFIDDDCDATAKFFVSSFDRTRVVVQGRVQAAANVKQWHAGFG